MKNHKSQNVLYGNRQLVTLVIFLFAHSLFAQGVGDEEVIVVKEFEATIADAQKVNIAPLVPAIDEKKEKLDYNIPAREFKELGFEPNPAKPLSMSKEKWQKFNSSYIKLGFGSQLTPLAQLAFNDTRKNIKYGVWYDHLSARGFQNKLMRFSDDEAGVYANFFPKTYEVGTAFTFHNNRTHFYGHSDTVEYEAKNIRQELRDYDAQLWFKNVQKNTYNIDFSIPLRFNYFQETFGKAHEWFIAGRTDIHALLQPKKPHHINAFFDFDVSTLVHDTTRVQRNIFQIGASYVFDNGDWKARGGIGLVVDGNKVYPLPDIYIEKRLYEHGIIAYGGYQIRFTKNSLKSFAEQNNFVRNDNLPLNTRTGDAFAGLKGTLSSFSYNLGFHFNHINNLPLFVNDSTDTKRFIVLYEPKLLVYNFHFEMGYNMKESLRLLLIGDYRFYQMQQEAFAWHTPAFKATLRATYNWKNKIIAGVDVYGVTNAMAKTSFNTSRVLKGTCDVNLSLDYIFNKHFSFFGVLNNIAHQKYERWSQYPSFGINGLVGAKFSW